MRRLINWIDERTGIRSLLNGFLYRGVPRKVGWWYIFGSATMLVALIQGVTGIFLTLYYVPSPDAAYESVGYIMNNVTFGAFIRSLHHWSASAIVILMSLHLLRTLFFGAFKYPREASWLLGVGLFLVALGLALTGYLLPWDQRAYWGSTVSTEVAGTIPLIGPFLLRLARGGAEVGAATLTRFFSLHVMFLPLAAILLFLPHLYMVVRQGISNPPERKVPVPQNPEGYQEFYSERKKGGGTFYPKVIFKDSVAFLVIFGVLVALAIFVGVQSEPKADPTATDYIPRPEWYFLFLFQFLRLLPSNLEVVGTTVFPLLAVLILILLPFIDRNRFRHPFDRPPVTIVAALAVLGIGVLTLQGALAPAPVQSEVTRINVAQLTPIEEEGRVIYKENACAVCHAINGDGGTRGPDLAGVGKRLSPASLVAHLSPATGTSIMPAYALGNRELIALTSYLLTLTQPPTEKPPVTPMPKGEELFIAQGCQACHTINGVGGNIGPDLSNEGSVHDKAWIEEYLTNPTVVIPNTRMPVHVLSQPVIDSIADYLAGLKGGPLAGGPSVEAGKTIYDDQGCGVCHVINGVGGTLGPDLTQVGNRRDAETLVRYIQDPKSVDADSTMPPYGNLDEAQLQSLAMYLLSLVGKTPTGLPTLAPSPTPAASPTSPPTTAAHATASPGPTPTTAGPDGAMLFASYCAACHGDNGQGGAVAKDPINSPSFLSRTSDSELRTIINDGEGVMPAFSGRLTPEQVDALVRFMRSWEE